MSMLARLVLWVGTGALVLWLSSLLSWLFSRFASLCLLLYETRSASVKLLCAVTKLINANKQQPSR